MLKPDMEDIYRRLQAAEIILHYIIRKTVKRYPTQELPGIHEMRRDIWTSINSAMMKC